MEQDSFPDIDGYIKRLKSGSGTLRLGGSRLEPFQKSQIVKPKSTSRKNDVSAFKSLGKKFKEFDEEYQNLTQNNSLKKQYSNVWISNNHQSDNYNMKKQSNQQFDKTKRNFTNQHSKRIGTSRQETKTFLEDMQRLVDGQHDSLINRMNEFKKKVKEHIENEYFIFKQAMKAFVQDIFKASQSAFVLSYQKKVVQLNAEFFVISQQLSKLSNKIKGYVQGLDHPHWSKTIGQINDVQINRDVQKLVDRSERLQVKSAIVQLDKNQLVALQKIFRILLSPKKQYNK